MACLSSCLIVENRGQGRAREDKGGGGGRLRIEVWPFPPQSVRLFVRLSHMPECLVVSRRTIILQHYRLTEGIFSYECGYNTSTFLTLPFATSYSFPTSFISYFITFHSSHDISTLSSTLSSSIAPQAKHSWLVWQQRRRECPSMPAPHRTLWRSSWAGGRPGSGSSLNKPQKMVNTAIR